MSKIRDNFLSRNTPPKEAVNNMPKLKYATNGKRDIHGLEQEYDNAIAKLPTEKWKHPKNRDNIHQYLRDCKIGRAKSAGKNIRVGKSTLYRILGILRMTSEDWINKDFDECTTEDWARFYERMEEGKIKSQRGQTFKQTTRAKNYKVLRKFLKWRGEPEHGDDWVTTEETPTKEYLTRSEVERMVQGATSVRMKALIMLLFDSGARIEEIGNLRWKDLKEADDGHLKAHIRKETSKTNRERTVSLWLATDLLRTFKNAMKRKHGKDFNEDMFLYTTSYNNLYKTVHRIGEKVLGKKVTPHMMRHSSATYYASIIKTYQQFCTRYGWRLNSTSAQRYFHATDDEQVATAAKDHEIARFKTDFEKQRLENKQLQKQLEGLKEQMQAHDKAISELVEAKLQEILKKHKLKIKS